MKVVIEITKDEVREAIRDYIFDRVSTSYQHEFGDASLSFMDVNGELSNFTVTAECEIKPKEKKTK